MEKNIIFLDIDGVLNDEDYLVKCYMTHHKSMSMMHCPFNPRSLRNLKFLSDSIKKRKKEPLIVLSSTWRLDKDHITVLNARLAEFGLKVEKATPSLSFDKRGLEIIQFLKDNDLTKSPFCILDDDSFDIVCEECLIPHFCPVNRKRGLVKQNITRCMKILEYENGLFF